MAMFRKKYIFGYMKNAVNIKCKNHNLAIIILSTPETSLIKLFTVLSTLSTGFIYTKHLFCEIDVDMLPYPFGYAIFRNYEINALKYLNNPKEDLFSSCRIYNYIYTFYP